MSCDYSGGLYLHSRCHTDFPTWARLTGQTLVIECAYPGCKREVSRLQLAPSEAEKQAPSCYYEEKERAR